MDGYKKGSDAQAKDAPSLVIDQVHQSREEPKTLNKGFKILNQKLRGGYKITVNKEFITKDILSQAKVYYMPVPVKKLDPQEVQCLKEFVQEGGGLLVTAGEGTDKRHFNKVNTFLSEFGISFEKDAIARTVYAKDFFHPKEAYIRNACISELLDNLSGKKNRAEEIDETSHIFHSEHLSVVYPFGCSLHVNKPANPILSSGPLCFPSNRAIGAMVKVGKGTVIALGSSDLFDDYYISKADNLYLLTGIMKLLTAKDVKLENMDPDRAEYQERSEIPDTEALAERLRGCLQEGEEMPGDFVTLFDHGLFKFDTNLIPEGVKLYEKLNVKHEPLTLIPPQFEVPLPPLQPAAFMPCLRELPPPALDLFDLDQHFATEKVQMAQLTNKCSDADLEYYVREAGDVLGVVDRIREEEEEKDPNPVYTANRILEFILKKLVNYKKIDQENAPGQDGGLTPPAHEMAM